MVHGRIDAALLLIAPPEGQHAPREGARDGRRRHLARPHVGRRRPRRQDASWTRRADAYLSSARRTAFCCFARHDVAAGQPQIAALPQIRCRDRPSSATIARQSHIKVNMARIFLLLTSCEQRAASTRPCTRRTGVRCAGARRAMAADAPDRVTLRESSATLIIAVARAPAVQISIDRSVACPRLVAHACNAICTQSAGGHVVPSSPAEHAHSLAQFRPVSHSLTELDAPDQVPRV